YVEGMFAHFASADSADDTYFKHQVKKFAHMRSLLTVKPQWIHVDNTAASIFAKNIPSDCVRFGIGIYGLNPSSNPSSPDLKSSIPLEPAMSFESELTHVKTIHEGDGVGYGSTFVADQDTIIGTVPVGYADGFIRKFQGFKVKVGDEYCPIVGRVCMDQFMVKTTSYRSSGSKVRNLPSPPMEQTNIKEYADYVDTLRYEVACLLNDRFPPLYYEKQVRQ